MWALSREQTKLLTRWFDGEIEQEGERQRVEALLEEQPVAELWISVLKELRTATQGAFREVRAQADLSASEKVAERAIQAPALSELSLEELAPLLEAYHDEAVTEPERRAVEQLKAKRDDVEAFLAGLEALRQSVQAATAEQHASRPEIDLWESIEEGIDKVERERLIMRYVDDEIEDKAEREHVRSMLEDPSDPADALVEQLEELGVAVRAAHRETVKTDLSEIWAGVDEALSDEWQSSDSTGDVVSFEKRAKTGDTTTQNEESTGTQSGGPGRVIELFSEYGQAIAGAAAAIVLMFVGGLLYQNFVGTVPSGPQKQVVIVDDYKEKSSSVEVQPVKPTGTQNDSEESTVIWLSEEGKNQGASGKRQVGEPSQRKTTGGPDVGVDTENRNRDDRANRDFPDGGTPIEKNEGRQVPARDKPQEVDKPGEGPI